ncbi:MAG: class I SAM-dependent methyltransferase [Deferribacteraceae bacterium]|jgi:predicted O-methyltransferase YrrM|nr:class I SAM-dependent methyltransferase [Deferribacteraceae bacterium]
MDLPFNAMPGANYISDISDDIIPTLFRQKQAELKVPSLGKLGCRFISICAAISKAKTIIDIGCGIGVSTMALHLGAPTAQIHALDANPERAETCRTLLSNYPNITVYNEMAIPFLQRDETRYDMAFVDSIKKDYIAIWHTLRPRLNAGAVVVFDDVLLHGYVAEENATVPTKYRDGAAELRLFLEELSTDPTVKSQIIPIDGGMLMATYGLEQAPLVCHPK